MTRSNALWTRIPVAAAFCVSLLRSDTPAGAAASLVGMLAGIWVVEGLLRWRADRAIERNEEVLRENNDLARRLRRAAALMSVGAHNKAMEVLRHDQE